MPCTIFRPPGPPPCTFLPRPFEAVYDFRSPQAPPCTKTHDNRTRWECWRTKMVHGREAHGQIGQIANDSKRIRQQQRHWCRPTKSETLQKRRTNEPPPASSTHARPKRACAIDCASYARVILLWPTAYNCASDATVRATSQQCRRRAGGGSVPSGRAPARVDLCGAPSAVADRAVPNGRRNLQLFRGCE